MLPEVGGLEWLIIAIVALVFGVLRNVPGWDWLSPA